MTLGTQLSCAMWAMSGLSLALVILRLYTRIRIVKFIGAEDHLYAWTFILQLLFTIFIQVAIHAGLGRSFWTLTPALSSDAIFWSYRGELLRHRRECHGQAVYGHVSPARRAAEVAQGCLMDPRYYYHRDIDRAHHHAVESNHAGENSMGPAGGRQDSSISRSSRSMSGSEVHPSPSSRAA